MSKRPYRLVIQWLDRKGSAQFHKATEEGSSIRRAINQALKAFFTDRPRRKERLDAHASLTLSGQRMKLHATAPRKR